MALSSSSAPPTPSNAAGAPPDRTDHGALKALRERLAARYDLTLQTVTVAGTPFALTVVRDTNALLERIRAEEFARDERLPYWAEVWTSSLELARWSLEGGVGKGMPVLELGCGVGLVGVASARAGAHVTMTDYEPDALGFARLNWAANIPPGANPGEPRIALLDWRTPYRGERFPLVLGSDIAYDRFLFEPLLRCLQECLAPGGRVVLTDPDRSVGRAFLDLASRSGFTVESVAVPTSHNGRTIAVVRTTLRRSSSL